MRSTSPFFYVVFFALAAQSTQSFAEDQQRIYRSAYFLGRGDTGISVADREEAIHYNPAGLAQGKGIYKKTVLLSPHMEVSNDTRNLMQELSDDDVDMVSTFRERIGVPQHVGIYNFSGIMFRRAALGIVNSATTDILVYKAPEAGGLEAVDAKAVQNNGVTFTLAESYWSEHLLLGITGKYLQRGVAGLNVSVAEADKVKDIDSTSLAGIGTGGGADVGLMLKGSSRMQPAFGLSVMNVGETKFTEFSNEQATAEVTPLKQTVNAGVSITPGTKYSYFRLLLDYWDITNALGDDIYKKVHIGGELSVADTVGFTGGFSEGGSSGGLYVDVRLLRLDLGMYIQEMDDRVGVRPDRRIFGRISAGF